MVNERLGKIGEDVMMGIGVGKEEDIVKSR